MNGYARSLCAICNLPNKPASPASNGSWLCEECVESRALFLAKHTTLIPTVLDSLAWAADRARMAEREACAKECESEGARIESHPGHARFKDGTLVDREIVYSIQACETCAEKIRSRGEA